MSFELEFGSSGRNLSKRVYRVTFPPPTDIIITSNFIHFQAVVSFSQPVFGSEIDETVILSVSGGVKFCHHYF